MATESRRRLSSIRVRVTAAATVAVAVVLVVASGLLVMRQRSGLIEQLDESLSIQAMQTVAAIEAGNDVAPVADDDDRIVLVVDAAGAVVAASADLGDLVAPIVAAHARDSRDVIVDGDEYRVASRSFASPQGGEGRVYVAAEREDIDESVSELTTSLALIVPLAILALIALVWVAVGRTLRPVERMRAEVSGIGMSQLDRRLPVAPVDDEIARLAATMNDMLARLERSVRQQQRFVADASHELRSPLTRMRTELEVDERNPERADTAATRRSQLEEIATLQRLIDDLLLLARSDAGASGRSDAVDLDDLVFEEVRATDSSGVALDASRVSAAQIIGDADEWRRVIRNLIDNARRHAHSAVTVELEERDGTATLVVADDGPGIPAERRAEVFERFARLDESRTDGGGRAGLGLAIVHDIVTRCGGSIAIDESPSGGARFRITLTTT